MPRAGGKTYGNACYAGYDVDDLILLSNQKVVYCHIHLTIYSGIFKHFSKVNQFPK